MPPRLGSSIFTLARRRPAEASGTALAKASTSAKVVMAPASGMLQAFRQADEIGRLHFRSGHENVRARPVDGAARVTKEQQRNVALQ
jgi:hypothetical protein